MSTTLNVPVPDLLASLTSNDDSNPEKISIGQFSNSISSSVKSNLSKFSGQNNNNSNTINQNKTTIGRKIVIQQNLNQNSTQNINGIKIGATTGKLSSSSNPDSSISIGNGIVTPNTSSGDGKSPKSSVNQVGATSKLNLNDNGKGATNSNNTNNNLTVLHSILIDDSSIELPYITPIIPSVAQTNGNTTTLNGTGSRPNSSQNLLLSTGTGAATRFAPSDTSTLGLSQSGRLSQLQHLTSLASHPLVKSPSPRKPDNVQNQNGNLSIESGTDTTRKYPKFVGLTCGQVQSPSISDRILNGSSKKSQGNFLCPNLPASSLAMQNKTTENNCNKKEIPSYKKSNNNNNQINSSPYLYHRKNRVNLIGKNLHIKPLWSGPHRLTNKDLRKNINKNFDFTSSCSRANFENEFLDFMQDSSSAARLQNQMKKRRQKEKYLKQIQSTRRAAVVASRRSYGKGSR